MRRRALVLVLLGVGAAAIAVWVLRFRGGRSTALPPPAPTYVGRAACAECHSQEAKAYAGSDHDRAMRPASPATV